MRRIKKFLPTELSSVINKASSDLNWIVRNTKELNPQKARRGLFLFLRFFVRMIVRVSSYINQHKHRNILVGSAVLFTLFLVSLNTDLMPESNEPLIFDEEGKFIAAPPAPPSLTFPLGTDLGARSMVNLVLFGVKYTLGAVMGITLARLLIGILLALLTKLLYPGFKQYFSAFFWPFRYIPQLLVGIILMMPIASSPSGISAMVILEYQLIIMLLVGLPSVYTYILDMVDEIERQPYVLSSTLMGASKFYMLKKHIWPNAKSHLLLLTTQQILSILQLLTFLGIFSLYLGGPHPTPLTDTPRLIYRSITNELAGMAGQNFWLIRRAPWMAYSPILIIAFIAIIVNWMKKGIEDNLAGIVPVRNRVKAAAEQVIKTDTIIPQNFVLVGVPQQAKTEYKEKTYISDLVSEKLTIARRYLSQFTVYRFIEKLAIRTSEHISYYPKAAFTVLLTLSFLLWAGVFSYSNFFADENTRKEEKIVGASAEPIDVKDLFSSSFTNKEHVPVQYKADLTYLAADSTLQGTLHVTTTNTTGTNQDKIYFHLYPNQFKEPIDEPEWEFIRGPSPTPGWIDIVDIKVNNEEADFKVEGTILEIQMEEWKAKSAAELDIQFNFQLPSNYSNASYDYAAVWLGSFLPIQAVHDKNGWNLDPYSPFGFPFYSETANYDVAINAPAKYEILSNAEEANATTEIEGENKKYSAKAEGVRDFSIVLLDSQYYQTERFMTSNETLVNVWYRPATDKQTTANRNAMGAGQSIDYFEEFFDSTLPYKELDIIRTGEGSPQISYQGMIFSAGYNFSDNSYTSLSMTDGVIRQWLSGLVGTHGYKEPWVNESLVSYSLKTYMGEKGYMERSSAEEQIKQQEEIARIQKEGQYLSSPLSDYKDINDYSVMMGIQGYNMYAELDYLVKAGKVNKALKRYIHDYTNKNASGHDVITLFEKAGHPQAKGYFKEWLKPEVKE